jgi:dimethylhistidine N-methyltransferase
MTRGVEGVAFHDYEPADDDFRAAVLDGLSRRDKALPCKFFYDSHGSLLFDAICALEAYYPTRTELALLRAEGGALRSLTGPGATVVEFGSGSGTKTEVLLAVLDRPVGYVAIDIARAPLLSATSTLARRFPKLKIAAVCADYSQAFDLPALGVAGATRLGVFFGSTIGNLSREEAVRFLANARVRLGRGGALLLGVDLKKDRRVLEAAYDDRAGVTALFNLNLLRRINRELGGNFDLAAFAHRAVYVEAPGRIEMHLVSLRAQTVRVSGMSFPFTAGESIHTENAHKYTVAEVQALAAEAGYQAAASWTDPAQLFSLHYLTPL